MEKTEIALSFDAERMRALSIYLKMEDPTVQAKLDESMRQLYEEVVPAPVREYLDTASTSQSRSKRLSRSSQSKADPPKAETADPLKTPPGGQTEGGA